MKHKNLAGILLAALVALAALAASGSASALTGTKIPWKVVNGRYQVPICGNSKTRQEDAWIVEALKRTWFAVAALDLIPSPPGSCAQTGGITLTYRDDCPGGYCAPHVFAGFGTNKSELVFPYSWVKHYRKNECKPGSAKRMDCYQLYGPHEVGHALGFAEEHQRKDSPRECANQPRDSIAPKLSAYDRNSVMMYCDGPKFLNNGSLSQADVAGVQFLYGAQPSACLWENKSGKCPNCTGNGASVCARRGETIDLRTAFGGRLKGKASVLFRYAGARAIICNNKGGCINGEDFGKYYGWYNDQITTVQVY